MSQVSEKKLGFVEKFVYGSGDIGLNAMFSVFASYTLFFYTDVVGMNAAIIGMVILVSRIFDGITDVLAGQWIDTHKRKNGHCIPILFKWSVPCVISSVLVFLVPNSGTALRVVFIFITYNLFNSVLYTLVGLAHNTLASYATGDSVSRSQMLCYKMLFAATTQMVLANITLPLVNFFGGQNSQTAWVKTCLLFNVIGLVFLYLNVIFVKERVSNPAQPENIREGLKSAIKNKYWLMMVVLQLCCMMQLVFNLTISVYYLGNVIGNLSLIGLYITLSNAPGTFIMFIIPPMLHKLSKRNLAFFGTALCMLAQIVFCLSPTQSTTMLFITALVRGIGFAFTMGLVNAMVGDTADYGEWKTGIRVQGVLFAAKSFAEKVAGGGITAAFGLFLAAIGYDGLAQVQTAGTVTGIELFFKFVPIGVYVIQVIILFAYKLDKEAPQIKIDLEARRAAKA